MSKTKPDFKLDASIIKEGEVKVKDTDNSENAKSQKGPGKRGTAKPSHLKNASATQVKKGKDGRDAEVQLTVSNGSVAVNSQLKQHLKSKSFNERQGQASKVEIDIAFCFCTYDHLCICLSFFCSYSFNSNLGRLMQDHLKALCMYCLHCLRVAFSFFLMSWSCMSIFVNFTSSV